MHMMDARMDSSGLDALPQDVLSIVLSFLPPECIIAGVAPTCRSLEAASRADSLWRSLLEERYSKVLSTSLFNNTCPPPSAGYTWRAHYFNFSSHFLAHARDFAGRLALEIDGNIYDATGYLDDHPGEPEVLLAAAGHDASAVFHAVGHSPNAMRILKRLIVAPRAELIPPEEDEAAAWRRRRLSSSSGSGNLEPHDGTDAPSSSSASTASSSTAATSWVGLASTVYGAMRSEGGRAKLREAASMVFEALLRDLTEGRPDCRRLSPAVYHLAMSKLSAVGEAAEEHEWKRRRRGSKSEEEEDEPMAADAWPVTG